MKRTIRKQTQQDFFSRIERLDPAFAAKAPSERFDDKPWEHQKASRFKGESPIMMAGLGTACALVALFGVDDPDMVREILLKTGWPAQFLTYAMNGAAILLFIMAVLLIGNVLRIFNPRATGRWNAGGLVAGALAGAIAFNMPSTYVQAAYEVAGFNNATEVLDFAQAKTLGFAGIDWASVVMVSSAAK